MPTKKEEVIRQKEVGNHRARLEGLNSLPFLVLDCPRNFLPKSFYAKNKEVWGEEVTLL